MNIHKNEMSFLHDNCCSAEHYIEWITHLKSLLNAVDHSSSATDADNLVANFLTLALFASLISIMLVAL